LDKQDEKVREVIDEFRREVDDIEAEMRNEHEADGGPGKMADGFEEEIRRIEAELDDLDGFLDELEEGNDASEEGNRSDEGERPVVETQVANHDAKSQSDSDGQVSTPQGQAPETSTTGAQAEGSSAEASVAR
jgi:hypothetical protein